MLNTTQNIKHTGEVSWHSGKSKLYFYIIILLSLFFSVYEKTNAQSWLWAKSIGGVGYDYEQAISVDPGSGAVYTTGSFEGTVDFDPGPDTFNLTSSGGQDFFISKLDSAGNFVWAKAILGALSHSIALDASGNVYTTGSFYGTVDFDPGEGIFNLTSPEYYYYYECWDEYCGCYFDCSYYGNRTAWFISKLDGAGSFVWAKALGGAENSESVGYSIAIDPSGSGAIYTTGYFSGTVDFDPDSSATFNLTSTGSNDYDIFISKLDGAGDFVWAKAMGGTSYDWGLSIAIDPGSGDVYSTGFFGGTADFDPGVETFNLTSTGSKDFFISKLDDTGSFIWAVSLGGPQSWGDLSDSHAIDIAVDPGGSGDVYTTGNFNGTFDFDPGEGTYNLTSVGYYDIFISKLNVAGNFVWAKAVGGPDFDGGYAIALDPTGSGDVYTTGNFAGIVDFNPGAETFNLTTDGSTDIFISKLDGAGNFVWAKSAGGADYAEYSKSIVVDTSGHVLVAGYFYSPSMSVDTTTLTNHDMECFDEYGNPFTCYASDVFILKLDGIAPSCNSLMVTSIEDNGDGSLRDVISCASNGGTITFDNSLMDQTITLTSGEIVINKNLILSGPGMTHLTITGKISRIFRLLPGSNLEIKDLSLKYANGGTNGGALFVKGHLTLENVLLEENFENGIPKSMTLVSPGELTVVGNVDIKN